jgi:hypothetical protein
MRQAGPGRALPSAEPVNIAATLGGCVVLIGHAPNVPYILVGSSHPRTTTVNAHALRAVHQPVRTWPRVLPKLAC